MHKEVIIAREQDLTVGEFRKALVASTLGERRPIEDEERLKAMLAHANLILTARIDGEIVGVARALTDFSYCCYLSDLAVDETVQRAGIGRKLLAGLWDYLHPKATLILLAAPKAVDYYPKVGFEKHPAAYVQRRE